MVLKRCMLTSLSSVKGRDNDDKKKTYKELLEIMKRHIARVREDRNIAARDKFATDHQSLRLQHLHRRMVRPESQVHQHLRVSLDPSSPIRQSKESWQRERQGWSKV